MENAFNKLYINTFRILLCYFSPRVTNQLFCSVKLYMPSSADNVDKSKLYQRPNDERRASYEPHFTGHNVRHGRHCAAGLAREGDEGQDRADAWKQCADLYWFYLVLVERKLRERDERMDGWITYTWKNRAQEERCY